MERQVQRCLNANDWPFSPLLVLYLHFTERKLYLIKILLKCFNDCKGCEQIFGLGLDRDIPCIFHKTNGSRPCFPIQK